MKYKVGQIYKCGTNGNKVRITKVDYPYIHWVRTDGAYIDYHSADLMDNYYTLVNIKACKLEVPKLEPQEFNQKQAISKIVIEE